MEAQVRLALSVAGACITPQGDTGNTWKIPRGRMESTRFGLYLQSCHKSVTIGSKSSASLSASPKCLCLSFSFCPCRLLRGKKLNEKSFALLFPVSWALLSVVHGWIMWQRTNLRCFPATKKLLSHIQITSYLLSSSEGSKLFGAKMQLIMFFCSTDVLIKILRKCK